MFRNRINNQVPHSCSIPQSHPNSFQVTCPSLLQRQAISYSVFLQHQGTNVDRLPFWEGERKRESQFANLSKLHREGIRKDVEGFQQGKVKQKWRQEAQCGMGKDQHFIPIHNTINYSNNNSITQNNNNNIFFNNSIAFMDHRNGRQHGIQDERLSHRYDIEHEQQNEYEHDHEHFTLPLDFQLEQLQELEINKIKDIKSQQLGNKVLQFGKKQGKLKKRHKQYINHMKIIGYDKNNKYLLQKKKTKDKQTKPIFKNGHFDQIVVQSPQQIVLQKTKVKQKKRYEIQQEKQNENESSNNSNNNKKTQYLNMDKLKQRYQFLERKINQNQKGEANFKTKIKGKNVQGSLEQKDLITIHEVRSSDIIIHDQNKNLKKLQEQNKENMENMEKTKQHIKKITKFIRDKDKFKDLTFKLLNKGPKPNKNLTQRVLTYKRIFPQQTPSQIQSPMSQFSHQSPSQQQKSPTPAQVSNPSQAETSNQQSLQARIGLIRPSLCHAHKISSAFISPFLSPLPSPAVTPLHSRSSSFALTQIDHINSINQELGLGLKIIDDSFQIQFEIQTQDQYQGKGKGKAKEIFDQILIHKGINSNSKIKQNKCPNDQYILHVGKGQIDDFVLEESVISPDCQELRGKLDQMLEGRG